MIRSEDWKNIVVKRFKIVDFRANGFEEIVGSWVEPSLTITSSNPFDASGKHVRIFIPADPIAGLG